MIDTKITILYVEDDSEVREEFAEILTFLCDTVHVAANGEEGLSLYKQYAIDIIITDISMPHMNGIEMIHAIRKIDADVPVIITTAYSDKSYLLQAIEEGVKHYLIKPLKLDILEKELDEIKESILTQRTLLSYQQLRKERAVGLSKAGHNLYTHRLYSYYMHFSVGSEEELGQFWEAMLVRFDLQKIIDNLTEFMQFIFAIAEFILEKHFQFNIYVEEDIDYFYFTLDNLIVLQSTDIHTTLLRYCNEHNAKLQEDKLSIKLTKRLRLEESHKKSQASVNTSSEVASAVENEEVLRVYDFLDAETLEELNYFMMKLNTEIQLMGSSALEMDDIDMMNTLMRQIQSLLERSREAAVDDISRSLEHFAKLLDEHAETFLARSHELSHMVKAYMKDLLQWKEMTFYTGTPALDFLNNSIRANVEMIQSLFVEDSTHHESVDEIFNF